MLNTLRKDGQALWQRIVWLLLTRGQALAFVGSIGLSAVFGLTMNAPAYAASPSVSPAIARSSQQTALRVTTHSSALVTVPLHPLIAAAPPPKCDTSTDPGVTACLNNITAPIQGQVKIAYEIGVWATIICALLVLIWISPAGIISAAGSGYGVARIIIKWALILGLVLLGLNSYTILQWFLNSNSTIKPPTLPQFGN